MKEIVKKILSELSTLKTKLPPTHLESLSELEQLMNGLDQEIEEFQQALLDDYATHVFNPNHLTRELNTSLFGKSLH
jgi:predicted aldo/keto reductase-like oxidoreductase